MAGTPVTVYPGCAPYPAAEKARRIPAHLPAAVPSMKELTLHAWHADRGARFGEFAGFNMPLYYGRPIEEHQAVRNAVGVFDISHMGQFTVAGADAQAFLQHALANDVAAMVDGQALYSPLCREDGGVLDDLIVYRHDPTRYRVIVNAGTRAKDLAWLEGLAADFAAEVRDLSPDWCLFAVQGPQAFERLAPHLGMAPGGLGYYHFAETEAFGVPVFLARTGYTGEPGCELAVPAARAEEVWRGLTETLALPPIGLVARDTLRLEAAMALYGHELREAWHPLESGLAWAVKLDGPADFVGKAALQRAQAAGVTHRLVGLELTGRGIAREGYAVLEGGRPVGEVTSGSLSPTLGKAIALAHVEARVAKVGTPLAVEVRGRPVEAVVVRRPFYRNPALRA